MQINLILVELLTLEAELETFNNPLQNHSLCNSEISWDQISLRWKQRPSTARDQDQHKEMVWQEKVL